MFTLSHLFDWVWVWGWGRSHDVGLGDSMSPPLRLIKVFLKAGAVISIHEVTRCLAEGITSSRPIPKSRAACTCWLLVGGL